MPGEPGRLTHMNTPAIQGEPFGGTVIPMTSVAYGFCPEQGYPGIIFQVYLQEPFITKFLKEGPSIRYQISFGGRPVQPAIHCLESSVYIPYMETRRYILQCFVPGPQYVMGPCRVTLDIFGRGNRNIGSRLVLGTFTYIKNGIPLPCVKANAFR